MPKRKAANNPPKSKPKRSKTTTPSSEVAAPLRKGLTSLPLSKVTRLIESGPILLVTTGSLSVSTHNVMTMGFHTMIQHSSPTLVGAVIGPWDASFSLLKKHKQCVLAIPDVSIAEKVVDIGNYSVNEGESKWEKFDLEAVEAEKVDAPLVGGEGIIGNVECVVEDDKMVEKYNLWILKVVKVWVSKDKMKEKGGGKMFHHRGDGSFTVDSGEGWLDFREKMVKWKHLQD